MCIPGPARSYIRLNLFAVPFIQVLKNNARPTPWYHWLALGFILFQYPVSAFMLGVRPWWKVIRKTLPFPVLMRGPDCKIYGCFSDKNGQQPLLPCIMSPLADYSPAHGDPPVVPCWRAVWACIAMHLHELRYALWTWIHIIPAWVLTTLALPLMDIRAMLYLFQSALWGFIPTQSTQGYVYMWHLWHWHLGVFGVFFLPLSLVNLLLKVLLLPRFMQNELFSEDTWKAHWAWSKPLIVGYFGGSILQLVNGFRQYGRHAVDESDKSEASAPDRKESKTGKGTPNPLSHPAFCVWHTLGIVDAFLSVPPQYVLC
jgi:hypothetical protein